MTRKAGLIDQHRDSIAGVPQEDLTFTYGTVGASYTVTDADNDQNTDVLRRQGQCPPGHRPERQRDELDLLRLRIAPQPGQFGRHD